MSGRNISGSEEQAIEENRRNQLWEAIHERRGQIEKNKNTLEAVRTKLGKVKEIIADRKASIKWLETECAVIRKSLGLPEEDLDVHKEIERIKNGLKNLNLKDPEDKKKLKAAVPLVKSMRYHRHNTSPDRTGHHPSPADKQLFTE